MTSAPDARAVSRYQPEASRRMLRMPVPLPDPWACAFTSEDPSIAAAFDEEAAGTPVNLEQAIVSQDM